MRVLELFCGTKSISHAFERRGHITFTVDDDPQHEPDLCMDIMDFKPDMVPWPPDVVWASPPCNCFSVASVYVHWDKRGPELIPKTERALEAQRQVKHTLSLIHDLGPTYWFIENPRGMLRTMPFMRGLLRRTVTYCQYGDPRQKPTDIWTSCTGWQPKKICGPGDDCHEAAHRGAKTGTQGTANDIQRAIIPSALCDEIVRACEKEPSEPWF